MERVQSFDPIAYGCSRNYIDGAVSELGKYFTHGVISSVDFMQLLISGHGLESCKMILSQMAWREYFQSVWSERGDSIFKDIKNEQYPVQSFSMPACVADANTGIDVIDDAVIRLYSDGLMHNHERLWIASLVCNIAKYHWREPSKWLYYYLLDGDLASNCLSWQWVAGTFSSKKYLCNQDNINKFSRSTQSGSMIDVSYMELLDIQPDKKWREEREVILPDRVPAKIQQNTVEVFESSEEVTVLHSLWNLDPLWQEGEVERRVLLIEPSVLARYPMSKQRWQFLLSQISKFKRLDILYEDFSNISHHLPTKVKFLGHPLSRHWTGERVEEAKLFPEVKGYFPSFSKFWKRAQHDIKDLDHSPFRY